MAIQQTLLGLGAGGIDDWQFHLKNGEEFHHAERSQNQLHYDLYAAGVTTTSSGSSFTLGTSASQWLSSVDTYVGWQKIVTRSDRAGKIKIRLKGASSGTTTKAGSGSGDKGYRNWGRDIEAWYTFSGQRTFFIGLGACGQSIGWQHNSSPTNGTAGGGGATMFVYEKNSSYYPIMIAAGGGGATNYSGVIDHYKAQSTPDRYLGSAVPITQTSTGAWVQDICTARGVSNTHKYGVGRSAAGSGGSGWGVNSYPRTGAGGSAAYSSYYYNMVGYSTGNGDSNTSDNATGQAFEGGWGGGGAGYSGNWYPCGGGGFFGANEQEGGSYGLATTNQAYYTHNWHGGTPSSSSDNWKWGSISFISPSGGADVDGDDASTKQTEIDFISNSNTDHGWHHKDTSGNEAMLLKNNNNTADKGARGEAVIEFYEGSAI